VCVLCDVQSSQIISPAYGVQSPRSFQWEFVVLSNKWENLGEAEHTICICVAHVPAKHMYLRLSMHVVRLRNISLWSVKQVNKIEREIYTVSACLYAKISLFSVVKTEGTARKNVCYCMIILYKHISKALWYQSYCELQTTPN